MKKILSIILIIASILSVFAVTASAKTQREQEITVGKATPTVDAEIDMAEGWSAPLYINTMSMSNCWSTAPQTTEGVMYFAYSEEGLYYAADIVEDVHATYIDGTPTDGLNSFVYSTGSDDIDYSYGYNGDVFVLAFDVERMWYNAGYTGNSSYSPWYCVGLFEDGTAKMYRQIKRNGLDITEKVEVAATVTENGWRLEAYIPWDVVIEDVETCATREPVTYSKEMLAAGDYTVYAQAVYHDRFYDKEAGEVDTWSRYAAVAEWQPDGRPGSESSSINIPCYGFTLNMTKHSLEHRVITEPYIYDAGKVELWCTECGEYVDSYNKSVENNVGEFDDVKAKQWYSESIRYCAQHKYMDGTGYRLFDADATLTREMFVKILFNLSNNSEFDFTEDIPYTDVVKGSWYENAVGWAHLTGVTSGLSETTFGVGKSITRQELVTMLYNFCKYREYNLDIREDALPQFNDVNEVASWAYTALSWANDRGVVSGDNLGNVLPRKTAQRKEAAAIIERFAEYVVKAEYATSAMFLY
ncbi:MAG: S-layer homology domain-containing protein [Clostridia bacterium]|nr:S-layer homology domain-containing protein [Clostridia bacterium]